VALRPGIPQQGAIIGDWEDANITMSSGFGTVTDFSAKQRIIGTDIEFVVTGQTGTTAATDAYLELDDYTIQTDNIPVFGASATEFLVDGYGLRLWNGGGGDYNAASYRVQMAVDSAISSSRIYFSRSSGAGDDLGIPENANAWLSTNDGFILFFRVPINGFDQAFTPMASDVKFENSRARVAGDTATLNATPTIITFDNISGNFSGDGFTYNAGQYTCNFDGWVSVKSSLEAASGGGSGVTMVAQIFKNTTSVAENRKADVSFVSVSDMIEVAAGDTLEIRGSCPSGSPQLSSNSDGTYFTVARIPDFSARAVGSPFGGATASFTGDAGHGSTNNRIREFSSVVTTGDAFTAQNSATLGSSVTANYDMVMSIVYNDARTAGDFWFGISRNSTQLTTNIQSINAADREDVIRVNDANANVSVSPTIRVNKGDVIRPHTDNLPNSGAAGITCFMKVVCVERLG